MTSSYGTLKAGALDIGSRLKALYTEIMSRDDVKAELRELFKEVRILVVGRSGSGKSTIIRLVIGEKGPQTACRGRPGKQNIVIEWPHPDPDLPLIFHDTNGIDVRGDDRLKVIQQFLDEHQTKEDFKQRIHLVWYVFSGTDPRFLDDGGLLELLIKYKIPLLLIMTFNDHKSLVEENVDGRSLDELLGRIYKERSTREKAINEIIRLGNSPKFVKAQNDGSLVELGDVSGLRKLIRKTKKMMNEDCHLTWIACQVTNIKEKLGLCAQLIVKEKRTSSLVSGFVGTIPGIQEGQQALMLFIMTRSLVKIWGVPKELENALMNEFFINEGGNKILKNFFTTFISSMVVLFSGLAAVVNPIASPLLVSFWGASTFEQVKNSSSLLMAHGLLNLGAILYIKSIHFTKSNDWDKSLTEEHYVKYVHDFAHSKYPQQIKQILDEYNSPWEGTTRVSNQTHRLTSQLVNFYKELLNEQTKAQDTTMKACKEKMHEQNMTSYEAIYNFDDDDDDDEDGSL